MRLHDRISVSAISTRSWSLEEDLRYWSGAGIGLVGLSAAKLRRAGIREGVRRVIDSGLEVSNLLGPGPFTLSDSSLWPEQRDRMCELVEAAAEMGAGCLVVTTGSPGSSPWEEAADAFEEAAAPVLEVARERSVRIALEHTNSLRPDIGFLQTLRDAVDLAGRLDIGVCMECNACWLERGLEQTILSGVERLDLVQVSDFVIGTTDTPNRAVPGDGDIPLERIMGQVLDAGYRGAFDLEITGPRIEREGYESAIRRSVETLNEILCSVGG